MAIFAPIIAPKGFDTANFADNNAALSWITVIFPAMVPKEQGGYITLNESYFPGADKPGRDLLSRIIYGSRILLTIAIIGPFISIMVGIAVGLTSGYIGGKVDNILMRFVDVMYAFPTLLLIILLMGFFRTSTTQTDPIPLASALNQLDSALGGLLFIFMGIGAIAGASITNYESNYRIVSNREWQTTMFGSYVYDEPDLHRLRSPIMHVKCVKTPTLLVHGACDTLAPPGQSVEFYTALRHLENPTQLVIYPREPHGFIEQAHQRDLYQCIVAWIDKYL